MLLLAFGDGLFGMLPAAKVVNSPGSLFVSNKNRQTFKLQDSCACEPQYLCGIFLCAKRKLQTRLGQITLLKLLGTIFYILYIQ